MTLHTPYQYSSYTRQVGICFVRDLRANYEWSQRGTSLRGACSLDEGHNPMIRSAGDRKLWEFTISSVTCQRFLLDPDRIRNPVGCESIKNTLENYFVGGASLKGEICKQHL